MFHRVPLLLFAAALVAGTACQGTGMGWIPSAADPTQKATFGFVFYNEAGSDLWTFSGSYHDKAAGVEFKGSGVMKASPPPPGMLTKGGMCVSGPAAFESPAGPGEVDITVCDLDGSGLEDFIQLTIMPLSPFFPYSNGGTPSGNITVSSR